MNPNLVLTCALMAVATCAGAQAIPSEPWESMAVGGAIGAVAPLGDFLNRADRGFDVTGAVSFQQRDSPFSFRVEAMYDQFANFNGSGLTQVYGLTTSATVGAIVGSTGPYAIAGIGVYTVNEPAADSANGYGSTAVAGRFGFNVGGGYRFHLAGYSAYAEARFYQLISGGYAFAPASLALTF